MKRQNVRNPVLIRLQAQQARPAWGSGRRRSKPLTACWDGRKNSDAVGALRFGSADLPRVWSRVG